MENETTAPNGTAAAASHEGNGRVEDEAAEPRPTTSRPAVRYATDEEAARAGEKIFRVHHRLLAELAK